MIHQLKALIEWSLKTFFVKFSDHLVQSYKRSKFWGWEEISGFPRPKSDLRLKWPLTFMLRTLSPTTLLARPKTSFQCLLRYDALKFSTGHFSATLECGTKMAMSIEFPMAVYL